MLVSPEKKEKTLIFFFSFWSLMIDKSRITIQTQIITKQHLYNDLFLNYNLVCLLTVQLVFISASQKE